jgi:hypothetical protein
MRISLAAALSAAVCVASALLSQGADAQPIASQRAGATWGPDFRQARTVCELDRATNRRVCRIDRSQPPTVCHWVRDQNGNLVRDCY